MTIPRNGSMLITLWVLNRENESIEEINSFGITELISIDSKNFNEELWNKFILQRNKLW